MNCIQKTFTLPAFRRGYHLITSHILQEIPEMKKISAGVAHIFIHHTSAGLTINENADPSVRRDFEKHMNTMVPENPLYYEHNDEGSDDMPAHIKASLFGSSVSVPVKEGAFLLGVWQGIYLTEHRNRISSGRTITVTVMGI